MALTAPTTDKGAEMISLTEDVLRFIFSGLALAAIAVILGGQWLGNCLNIHRTPRALFRVPIPGFFKVEASGNDVGLGFTGFIGTLLLVAVPAGKQAYGLMKDRIGVDLGQFDSLCILSSFLTLVWTFLVYLIVKRPWTPIDPIVDEQRRRLESISTDGEEDGG